MMQDYTKIDSTIDFERWIKMRKSFMFLYINISIILTSISASLSHISTRKDSSKAISLLDELFNRNRRDRSITALPKKG